MINTITYGLTQAQLTGQNRASNADEPARDKAETSGDRTVRDTIELSEEGQKIINLARGDELASALPDATQDRAAFDAALERAQEDIKRITTLFGGVLNPFGGADFGNVDGQDSITADQEFAETLRQAFTDIREITAAVDTTIQQRRAEF